MDLLNAFLFIINGMSPYILLGFFIVGIMHAFIPQHTLAYHLSGTGWKSVIKVAAIGVPLPLCSCGVLPTAIAMRRNGASRAASISFLVSTPQTGMDSIAATWSLLGPAFAILHPFAALITAVFAGVAVGKSEKDTLEDACTSQCEIPDEPTKFSVKCFKALRYGFIDLVGSIGGWLVIGLIIATLITVYVPADFFSIFSNRPFLSMIAVLIIAIPMYVCATGSIPIALSLVLKGLSPGTAFVLLMAGPAANFASFALIVREMGRKTAIVYLLSIVLGAIAFGLTIDYLLPAHWFDVSSKHAMTGHEHGFSIFPSMCSAILLVLLIITFIKRYKRHNINHSTMTKEYTIKGMSCPHCQATVIKCISEIKGVKQVDVNLSTGKAVVEGEHNSADIVAAVRNAGFDVFQ